MLIIDPCAILILENVDCGVFVGQTQTSIPVKRIPTQIHVADKAWANSLNWLPVNGLGLTGSFCNLEYQWSQLRDRSTEVFVG